MLEITQAFIFCAGRGERMKPLTNSIPKPLAKVNDKAIVDYVIEKIDKINSIKKIIINGFYLSEQIANHIKKLNNPKIIFSQENQKIETGGALVFAQDLIDLSQPLLLANGDVLWQEDKSSDIELLAKNFDSATHDMLLGLKKVEDYQGVEPRKNGKYGDFNLVDNGNLYRYSESDMSHCFVGLQIINPKIIAQAPSECFSLSHYFLSSVGERGLLHRIQGLELKGKYYHIGTVDALKQTQELINTKN